MVNRSKGGQLVYKLALATILFPGTGFLFIGDHLRSVSVGTRTVLTAIPAAFLLALTLFFRRSERFRKYWEVAFAFFCGSFGLFLAWAPWFSIETYFRVSDETAKGVALLKLFELLPVALAILVLTKIVQGNLKPIYIQRGNLRVGLGLGLALGLLILGVYLVMSWSTIDLEKALPALGWMILFAILDAFFEVLLVQALFLRRYITLLGTAWAIGLSALCYGLFFLGVQSATGPIPFGALILILPLGLVYAFLLHRSDSLWGSVSLHAAVDLVYLIGIFAVI